MSPTPFDQARPATDESKSTRHTVATCAAPGGHGHSPAVVSAATIAGDPSGPRHHRPETGGSVRGPAAACTQQSNAPLLATPSTGVLSRRHPWLRHYRDRMRLPSSLGPHQ